MESYCNNVTIFDNLKAVFFKDAFTPHINTCAINTTNACIDADKLYNYTITNNNFIKEMKKGCSMGGNTTACKIGTSGVDDILNEFSNSYHDYKQHPSYLCSAFSEYANNVMDLFITGGCYLYSNHTHTLICGYEC
jgi:hypothetical protein